MDIRNVQGIDGGWDDYVLKSPGGTIFHTARFLSYHPAARFEFMNLAVGEGDDLVCVLPGGRVSTGEGSVFRSPVGASFGGPQTPASPPEGWKDRRIGRLIDGVDTSLRSNESAALLIQVHTSGAPVVVDLAEHGAHEPEQ